MKVQIMPDEQRYSIPGETCRVVEEIKRSRFITTVGYTPSEEEARAFIETIRAEFADASHHCWAFLVGCPGDTGRVGMSDDGEPHRTAGRPMLTVLTHCGVGDITAVVVRYFGGTKLGKGGLVRAYSGGVQKALSELRLSEHVVYAALLLVVDYARVSMFKRMLPEFEVQVVSEDFGADVTYTLKLPKAKVDVFRLALDNLTNGEAQVEVIASDEG
ncbi:MAG: YigZ family protein [bacterium]|nr:YigZ family protein [bacterium]